MTVQTFLKPDNRKLWKTLFIFIMTAVLLLPFVPVHGSDDREEEFRANDILFYDGGDYECVPSLTSNIGPGNVYIVGDSITNGSISNLQEKFTSPWSMDDNHINAEDNRSVAVADDIINADASYVADSVAIVIALGTNDAKQDFSSHIKKAISAVRAHNQTAPIFWVDVGISAYDPSPGNISIYDLYESEEYKPISWFKAIFPDSNPVKASDVVGTTNEYLESDNTHPNADGKDLFAQTIYDEISKYQISFGASDMGSGGSDNAATAFSFFIQKGLTNEQSAGILGNLIAESQIGGDRNIYSNRVQGTYTENTGVKDGYHNPLDLAYPSGVQAGYGIAQWTYLSRKERFVLFAEARKDVYRDDKTATGSPPYDSLLMQLDLIWFGMTGEPSVRGVSGGMFASTLTGLRDSTTVEEAAVVFHGLYEGSSAYQDYINNPVKDEAAYERAFRGRINLAEEAYEKYAGKFSNGTGCEGSNTNGLTNTILAYAWPEWRGRRTDYAMERKPEYKTAVEAANARGEYVGGASGIAHKTSGVIGVLGVDCGGFVTRVMRDSGYDPEYNFAPRGGSTIYQKQYLSDPSNGWIPVDINSTKDLRPGDVYIRDKNDTGGDYGHTYIFVGDIPGFGSKIASSGVQSRAPVAGDERLVDNRYSVFRRVE